MCCISSFSTIDQDKLAQALGLDRATTGAIAAGLERKNLINRASRQRTDAKRVITLTDGGTNLFFSAETAAIEARQAINEQRTFMNLLRKIALTTSPHIKAQLKTDWK